MLKWFAADLHIHTVLSPCAELDMGPINIVEVAGKLGLDIIGITDLGAVDGDIGTWDERRALRSMLFTLMEFPHIQNVQLLVQGQIVGYLSEQPDLNSARQVMEVNLVANQRNGKR